MPDPLTVRVPMTPSTKTNPNSSTPQRTVKRHRHTLRDAAALATRGTLRGLPWGHPGPLTVDVQIYWERNRRTVDLDNANAMLKGAMDGIFANLDADDRQIVTSHITQHRDPEGAGFVVVTITALDTRKDAA